MGFGLNQVNNLEKQSHSGLGEPGCDSLAPASLFGKWSSILFSCLPFTMVRVGSVFVNWFMGSVFF